MKPYVILFLAALSTLAQAVGAADSATHKDRAITALEEDLKADPNNPELWQHLGFAYRKMEKIDQAQKAFEKTVSLNPQAKEAYFMLGLIYESKRQDPDAERAWRNYLNLEKDPERRAVAEKHIHKLKQ